MALKKKSLEYLKRYALIMVGCIIYSLGVSFFLDANNIASGGVTGIAIIIRYLLGFTPVTNFLSEELLTGILIVIINIPLFIIGFIFVGKGFTLSSLFATVFSSALIEVWNILLEKFINHAVTDTLIAALVGGVLFGGGLGLIFRMGSSTGGTDILVKLLRKKFRYINTGIISMVIDIIIVCCSFAVFRDFNLLCYTIISIVLFTVGFDAVLYGGNSAKLVYIISVEEKAQEICDRITKELDVGATVTDGKGAYTGDNKRMILCAIKSFLYPKLRDVVKECDPAAFMVVTSAKEIYGEGYKNHTDEEL
ncbi:MAG: YitT family protein [Clostridia bacterium]|nr:YitT family protein [Clostridia bacterium]